MREMRSRSLFPRSVSPLTEPLCRSMTMLAASGGRSRSAANRRPACSSFTIWLPVARADRRVGAARGLYRSLRAVLHLGHVWTLSGYHYQYICF